MMKFFRSIRYSLAGKNQSGKYFKYAIGEIVLVVIGILIALQINNWNEARKDNEALKEYLEKVKSHTIEDLRLIDTLTVFRKNIATQCKMARKHMLDKTEDENLILFMSCGYAFADLYFKPNMDGYEALKNSGYFGKINNTLLDSLLTRYHRIVDDIAQNETSYNEYVVNQEAYISTQFDRYLILASAFLPPDSLKLRATPQSEYYADFAEYTASAPYRNVISLAAFQFDAMISQYDQLRDAGQGVIKEIDILIND